MDWYLEVRILSRRQTVFFLPVDPRDESHKNPEFFDFSAPRLARYMHRAWKRHQDTVFWVVFDLGIREGLVSYQTRSNAIILQGTLPTHCIVKVERLKTGEELYETQYLSPRPPPKISLKHDLNWTKGNDQGSTVEHQPVGKLFQQSLGEAIQAGSSKPTQSKPIDDRTEKLVTQEIVGKLQGKLGSSDRTGETCERWRTVASWKITIERWNLLEASSHKVHEVGSLEHRDDVNKFNLAIDDEKIDFNISGVPNTMEKRSQSINVHNLIQKIENHLQRSDLQQHRAFNPFSAESKDAIKAAGNTELFVIINRGAEITVQSMPNVWERRHCILYMWTSYERWYCRKLEVHLIRAGFVLHPELLHKEGPTTRSQVWESTWMQRVPYGKSTSKENAARRSMTASTIDSSATRPSGRRWSSWVALKMSSLKWIDFQAKTTVTLPQKKKLTSTVATGGFARTWWISIRCREGVNLTSRKHCRHCTASRKRRTRSNMKSGHKVPPHGGQWQTKWWESDHENSPQRWCDH